MMAITQAELDEEKLAALKQLKAVDSEDAQLSRRLSAI